MIISPTFINFLNPNLCSVSVSINIRQKSFHCNGWGHSSSLWGWWWIATLSYTCSNAPSNTYCQQFTSHIVTFHLIPLSPHPTTAHHTLTISPSSTVTITASDIVRSDKHCTNIFQIQKTYLTLIMGRGEWLKAYQNDYLSGNNVRLTSNHIWVCPFSRGPSEKIVQYEPWKDPGGPCLPRVS